MLRSLRFLQGESRRNRRQFGPIPAGVLERLVQFQIILGKRHVDLLDLVEQRLHPLALARRQRLVSSDSSWAQLGIVEVALSRLPRKLFQ